MSVTVFTHKLSTLVGVVQQVVKRFDSELGFGYTTIRILRSGQSFQLQHYAGVALIGSIGDEAGGTLLVTHTHKPFVFSLGGEKKPKPKGGVIKVTSEATKKDKKLSVLNELCLVSTLDAIECVVPIERPSVPRFSYVCFDLRDSFRATPSFFFCEMLLSQANCWATQQKLPHRRRDPEERFPDPAR
jgi:hypothetical protein